MTVTEVPVTPDLTADLLDHITFVDCYEATPVHKQDLSEIYWAIFAHSPGWVTWLMNTRNRIVGILGLKTASPDEAKSAHTLPAKDKIEVGKRLGMFTLLHLSENQLVTGENDRHLDFRISLTWAGPKTIRMTTVVNTHNTLGKIYMAFIKPFHKLIARTMINTALKAGRL